MLFTGVLYESMKIGDVPADDYPRKKLARLLSFVPQKTDIETDFTAEEIVMTGRTPYQGRFEGTSIGDKEAVYRAFSLTKADKLKDKKFAILSGGEKQKIVIARAVAQTTPWMLLDEPIASLDIKNQIEIMKTLLELNRQEGVSVLMVLHDINLAVLFLYPYEKMIYHKVSLSSLHIDIHLYFLLQLLVRPLA